MKIIPFKKRKRFSKGYYGNPNEEGNSGKISYLEDDKASDICYEYQENGINRYLKFEIINNPSEKNKVNAIELFEDISNNNIEQEDEIQNDIEEGVDTESGNTNKENVNKSDFTLGGLTVDMKIEKCKEVLGDSYIKYIESDEEGDTFLEYENIKLALRRGIDMFTISSDQLEGPRGTKIGDSVQEVIDKYYYEHNEDTKDGEFTYKLLYGNYTDPNTSGLGYIAYDDGQIVEIVYKIEQENIMYSLTYRIGNNKVNNITIERYNADSFL